jgi:Mitochondrial ribosomal protein (VAR1)
MVYLVDLLNKIYNKKININIVKLKNLFLDNSLITDAIVRKLNDRNKRVRQVIKKFFKMTKKAVLDSDLLKKRFRSKVYYNNNDINNKILSVNKYNVIFSNLHHKYLTGIKLQGNGRLTKRLTASRSILKHNKIGRLRDVVSSIQK